MTLSPERRGVPVARPERSARRFAAPTFLAALLLLSACGAPRLSPPAPAQGGAAPATSVHRPSSDYAYATPEAPAERRIDPALLIGRDADSIEAELGRPDFVRKETGARVWQYFAGDCILDLFLYQDGKGEEKEGAAFRAVHYELRSRIPEDPGRCPKDEGFALNASKG